MEIPDRERDEPFGHEVLDALVGQTATEIRDVIDALIEHRERLRDEELRSIESRVSRLIGELEEWDRRRLIAELSCFRDLLSLHRRRPDE